MDMSPLHATVLVVTHNVYAIEREAFGVYERRSQIDTFS